MIKSARHYKNLAQTYKDQRDILDEQLIEAREQINLIGEMVHDRAALVSLTREGSKLRFMFVRHGETIVIETYGTWSDGLEKAKQQLLEKRDETDNG